MILIDRTETDPYFNLAAEEYVLREMKEDVFMLWINEPSIIIGKHQIATAEANIIHAYRNNIPVIRRISGGGTVYHDQGNLNYSLATNGEKGKLVDYEKYSGTVIRALATQSVKAKLSGKSSLAINGLKFSGNAEHVYKERVLHHGTLLFDSDIESLRKCIRPDHSGYDDSSVRSADSRITNLKDHLPKNISLKDFRELLKMQLKIDFPGIEEYCFDQQDIMRIRKLAQERYMTREWNFAYSPAYNLTKDIVINKEHYTYEMRVEKGMIIKMGFSQNGSIALDDLSKKLIKTFHHPKEIEDVLISFNFADDKIAGGKDRIIASLF